MEATETCFNLGKEIYWNGIGVHRIDGVLETRLGNGEVVIVSSELWRIPVGLVAERI